MIAELADKMPRIVLAAEAERDAACESEHCDESGNKRIDDRDRDAELGKRRQEPEEDDSPPCHGSKELRRMQVRALHRRADEAAKEVRHDEGREKDEDSHDDVRNVQERLLKECRKGVKAEYIRSREQEDDHEKPINKPAEKPTAVQRNPCAIEILLNSQAGERLIQADERDDAFH